MHAASALNQRRFGDIQCEFVFSMLLLYSSSKTLLCTSRAWFAATFKQLFLMFCKSVGDLVNLGIGLLPDWSKHSNIIAQNFSNSRTKEFDTHERTGALGRQFRTEHSHLVNEIALFKWDKYLNALVITFHVSCFGIKKPLFICDSVVNIICRNYVIISPKLQRQIHHVAS